MIVLDSWLTRTVLPAARGLVRPQAKAPVFRKSLFVRRCLFLPPLLEGCSWLEGRCPPVAVGSFIGALTVPMRFTESISLCCGVTDQTPRSGHLAHQRVSEGTWGKNL